jgi:tRNA(fMet)-specific endonuclease VapC
MRLLESLVSFKPISANKAAALAPNDTLIAAIALANDLTLVTNNTREFSRVPNLKIEDWQS